MDDCGPVPGPCSQWGRAVWTGLPHSCSACLPSTCTSVPFEAGGSTPPGITAPAVPSIPSPIGVNGFTGLPPQANGQPAAEAVFANGIHPYPGKHTW